MERHYPCRTSDWRMPLSALPPPWTPFPQQFNKFVSRHLLCTVQCFETVYGPTPSILMSRDTYIPMYLNEYLSTEQSSHYTTYYLGTRDEYHSLIVVLYKCFCSDQDRNQDGSWLVDKPGGYSDFGLLNSSYNPLYM